MIARAARVLASLAWSIVNVVARTFTRPRAGIFPTGACVVSVGNFQAGGTGKTPLVRSIAARWSKGPVLILLRGYRSEAERSREGCLIAPTSRGRAPVSAKAVGDEAALYAHFLPEAWIGVGADREAMAARAWSALERAGARADQLLVLLDDGLQRFKFPRHLDLILERREGLLSGRAVFRECPEWVAVGPALRLNLKDGVDGELRDLVALDPTQPMVLVTTFADPEPFRARLIARGIRVQRHFRFEDHHAFTAEEVREIERAAIHASLVMTGKDWVKWRERSAVACICLEPEAFVNPKRIPPELRRAFPNELWHAVQGGP